MKILIKNGHIVDPSQSLNKKADVLIEDGRIAQIAPQISAACERVVDASGLMVIPGLIDMHTHLREPGFEGKEDIVSGTQAAAHGGVTTVACMPNTQPVIDTSIIVSGIQARAARCGFAHVEVIGAITKGSQGKELAEMGDMAAHGAIAFSDDGHQVSSARMFLLAAQYAKGLNKPLISHAIDEELNTQGFMHEGTVSARLGMAGVPSVAEDIAVARDCLIAQYTGAHVHIAHISTQGAVDIVRHFKKQGVHVTAEATVHHLTLTDEACAGFNTAAKVSPPLRSADHVQAVRNGLLDGTIDIIVTDHSPHACEEKDVEFCHAPNGFTGLETSLGVLLTDLYQTGVIDLPTLINKMSCTPARLFGLPGGTLKLGAPADIALVDLQREWTVESRRFYTRGKFTPFEGKKCKGQVIATMLAGRFVMENGEVICK
ncbi:MAG: dihydroorotase [Elusimicrobiaceae bacterium]|nr:dihydroorotase [Elusimicrobiaceae bacterium]